MAVAPCLWDRLRLPIDARAARSNPNDPVDAWEIPTILIGLEPVPHASPCINLLVPWEDRSN